MCILYFQDIEVNLSRLNNTKWVKAIQAFKVCSNNNVGTHNV